MPGILASLIYIWIKQTNKQPNWVKTITLILLKQILKYWNGFYKYNKNLSGRV